MSTMNEKAQITLGKKNEEINAALHTPVQEAHREHEGRPEWR
jgi:hypothetical protein